MSEFYDVVDSEGNVIEVAAEQKAQIEEASAVVNSPVPLERERKQPTEGEMKKLRKQYVTMQNPKVVACGHSLDLSKQPRHRGCESCWFAFFNEHGEMVRQLDEMHTSGNDAIIVALQGSKFLHRWKQFMATIAQWKQKENDTQV
jgi:hypothetical protein